MGKGQGRSTLLKNNGTFPEETSVLLEMSLVLMECSIAKTGIKLCQER